MAEKYVLDYQQIRTAFLNELTKASKGKPSSISFIKHHFSQKPLITEGIVQGIVIGGTNYIVSTQQITKNGKRNVIEQKTGTLPTFETCQILNDFLSTHVDPRATAIGLNFGFPLEPSVGPFGELDAKLISGTKEHTFTGLTESLGTLTRKIFFEKYKKDIPVAVANDTVCLTLAGDGSENGSLIVGTGNNMCLKVISKNKTVIVNLESGNFNKFHTSDILKKLDAVSEKPGTYLLEKMVAGKYLADYFNEEAKQLKSKFTPLKTSKELSMIAAQTKKQSSRELARVLLKRSAFLVAAVVAGAYAFCDSPQHFTLIGEGSVLWKGWNYQENIQKQLSLLGIPDDTITFKNIKDSSINGAIGLLTL